LGELPLALQPKLLRVLEDGSMRRIGSHKERKVNVRIIAATNRDLANDVKAGRFREDLYYRVNVLPIYLPPLRERPGDVDILINHFLPSHWRVDTEARAAMNAYIWPGNVRELINVIQRATILADNQEITLDDLPREFVHESHKHHAIDHGSESLPTNNAISAQPTAGIPAAEVDSLDAIAKAHVLEVLAKNNGNKARAARSLGIHRRKLYRLLERFQPMSPGSELETAVETE